MSSLEGKVCLVTGATDGHGRAMARQLAKLGADVVVHGRNPEKCAAVQQEIAAHSGGKLPQVLLCDLASRESIDAAAAQYLASGRPLDILVNNAGMVSLERQESVDGHELVLAVNFFAMFQLTMRLWPRLVESAPARVINLSSDTYKIGNLDLDNLFNLNLYFNNLLNYKLFNYYDGLWACLIGKITRAGSNTADH